MTQQVKLVETMPLFILGFPLGEALATGKGNPAITVGKGSVSSIRLMDNGDLATVQIDGDITPGNSGGPVVDSRGHLVGVSQATIANRRIGFAIPAAELAGLLKGRLLDYHVDSKPAGNQVEVRVELSLFDPFDGLQGVSFYYTRGSAPADKKLANAPGVVKVPLERETSQVVGRFRLDAAATSPPQITIQAVYTDAEGTTFITNPTVRKLSKPGTVAMKPSNPAPQPDMRQPPGPPRPPVAGPAPDDRLTQANFDKVQVGMTEAEVHTLIGPPTRVNKLGPNTLHVWQDPMRVVSIQFRAGKLITKPGLGLK
jgi:hypothetical protein